MAEDGTAVVAEVTVAGGEVAGVIVVMGVVTLELVVGVSYVFLVSCLSGTYFCVVLEQKHCHILIILSV